jgi:hypothetical protein
MLNVPPLIVMLTPALTALADALDGIVTVCPPPEKSVNAPPVMDRVVSAVIASSLDVTSISPSVMVMSALSMPSNESVIVIVPPSISSVTSEWRASSPLAMMNVPSPIVMALLE